MPRYATLYPKDDKKMKGSFSSQMSEEVYERYGKVQLDPERKERISSWLQKYASSLIEIRSLPFCQAEFKYLLQHYFFFFSSKHETSFESSKTISESPSSPNTNSKPGLTRKISFRHVADAVTTSDSFSNLSKYSNSSKKRSLSNSDFCLKSKEGPHCKKSRNIPPKNHSYPRIKKKLDYLCHNSNEKEALTLVKQLNFMENLVQDQELKYSESNGNNYPKTLSKADIDIILGDIL